MNKAKKTAISIGVVIGLILGTAAITYAITMFFTNSPTYKSNIDRDNAFEIEFENPFLWH